METKKLRFLGLFMIVFMLFVHLSSAQVNMTVTGSYTQNFNSLSQSGSSNNFTNNSTISSWYIQRESGNANPNSYAASTGSSGGGSFYSFGSSGNSDRALGQVPSGSTNDMAIGLLLRNTSGATITNLSVSYTLEQWRKGSDNTQGIAFTYETSSSLITNLDPSVSSGSGWNSVSGLNLNGPISSGPDDIALNGNSGSNRVSVANVSIPGLSLADGDYIMLRWVDINSTGSDHGLSIDDVTVNYTIPSLIFSNAITTNSNSANPYTTNQIVDANATASGIGRGSGLDYESENGGYAANNYTTSNSLDANDYMYFTITPNIGYQLNFESFDYEEERTNDNGPEDFSFRSSLDDYGSSIQSYTLTSENATNRSIGLGDSEYQGVQSAITFRLFGWDASGGSSGSREYSINNFAFLGTVTMIPPTVSDTAPTEICDNASGVVTISGNNLIHVINVTVGGTPVTIDSQTNTQLVVTVPQGVSGLVTVTNEAGSANGATITLLNAITYYADLDGDGFGDAASSVSNCTGQPVGYVTNNLDCDDNLLLYEDIDNDGFGSLVLVACGGSINNLDTNDSLLTYIDSDGDTFGSTTLAPSGVTNNTDCNDNDNTIFPGATEICYDGIDQNCDGDLNDGCPIILAELRTDNCGSQLTTINQALRGDKLSSPVPNTVSLNGYRFRITNLTTNAVREVERPNYIFQISSTDIAQYGTVYAIEVAIRLNDQWMPYGSVCNVITPDIPSTVIAASSCESTLVQMNNIIRAVTVPAAVNYEYEVSLIEGGFPVETTTIIRPGASFNLLQLSGISLKYDAEYSIRVKVEVPTAIGLQWSTNYGTACSVFSPLVPEAQIEGCNDELGLFPESLNTVIYATPVGGAVSYRFTLSDGNGYFEQYTSSSRVCRLLNFDQLSPLTLGGNYSIQTEALVYGFYYPGKDCNITVPGGVLIRPSEQVEEVKVQQNFLVDFKAIAHPNPFSSNFAINLQTISKEPIQLAVYDMTGRLIETMALEADLLSSKTLGEVYPTGVYSIIVSQGEKNTIIRVVKK
jgi:hypothetical protein